MKKILFFESSLSLHKAIKLILSNVNLYEITIVDNLIKFEKEKKSQIFDLIITNVNLVNINLFKKNMEYQNVLIMFEKSDSIKDFEKGDHFNFIEKPFSSIDFKKKVDFILGVDDDSLSVLEQQNSSEKLIQSFVKETLEQWLREQAPQFAKDVIREEITKLIG
ncbi:hypothetical protein [Silvanigrella sp.]|jgi:DNA-binding NtrC family response regulator|uniref:hypothetical protein n=1 Tax=Silvanigrella sp. TaxID=2024976 RepID=UPI0037CA3F57|nr:DUF2497 domain-containing protein [Silvanigrellaceae bacterium]